MIFPQDAANDTVNLVSDFLAHDDLFLKPAAWLQLAGGFEFRADTHGQVEDSWRLRFSDRGVLRPRIAVTRLSATFDRRWLTVELGKQFIRWGTTDIVTPADRFAPRDFMDVVDYQFLAVTAVRAAAQIQNNSLEVVWVPRFTPSRDPLVDQRWTVVPGVAARVPIADVTTELPSGTQSGIRFRHVGGAVEYAASWFDGFNHLPIIDARFSPQAGQIEVTRLYPSIRSYAGDASVPLRWLTIKGEAAYVRSNDANADDYVLYVVELERQSGEWLLVAGYAGEVVTARRTLLSFAPDRGLTRSIVARASYTIDPNRSFALETAVRQGGGGLWAKVEYSHAYRAHWRAIASATAIAGHSDDFLGQYHRNSHVALTVRYSF